MWLDKCWLLQAHCYSWCSMCLSLLTDFWGKCGGKQTYIMPCSGHAWPHSFDPALNIISSNRLTNSNKRQACCTDIFSSVDQTCFMSGAAASGLQEIVDALRENARRIQWCKQQCRRAQKNLWRGGLTGLGVKRVLAVYALSSWSVEVAVQVAQQLTKLPRSHPEYPTSFLVQKLFVSADKEDLLCMYDPTHATWAAAMTFAYKALAEYEVFCWVRTQNFMHGCAPSAEQVFERFHCKMLGAKPEALPSRRTVSKWARRWRLRWGVRRAHLRPADYLDPSNLREKAGRHIQNSRFYFGTCLMAQKMGAEGMKVF